MSQSYITLFLLSFYLLTAHAQQAIDLRTGEAIHRRLSSAPQINSQLVDDGIIVSYELSHINLSDDDLYSGAKSIDISGFAKNMIASQPSFLYRGDSFFVPSNDNPTIEVLDSSYIDIPLELSPARPILSNSNHVTYSLSNVPPISPYAGRFPNSIIVDTISDDYKGEKLMTVYVCPTQYDKTNHRLRVFSRIVYKVNYNISRFSRNGIQKDPFLENITVNYSLIRGNNYTSNDRSEEITKKYLIVTVPQYLDAALKLARWKNTLGFGTDTLIVSPLWTENDLTTAIRNKYSADQNICYLLILGDLQDVTSHREQCPYDTLTYFYTDYYYGVKQAATQQEVPVGRLSVSTNAEAHIVVDKVIQYEKNPIEDSLFYKRCIHCAFFEEDITHLGMEDCRFVQTSEEIREYLMNHNKIVERIYYTPDSVYPMQWGYRPSAGDTIPLELRKPNFNWEGNTQNIIDAINQGAFYILYRGHGSPGSWSHPKLRSNNIDSLSNRNKLPIVFSLTCLTGQFGISTCFAEKFLRKENGGCVAVFAASCSSFVLYDDVLAEGMFDAIWPASSMTPLYYNGGSHVPIYSLGNILRQGLYRLCQYSSGGLYTHTKLITQCFGDPGMEIVTETPTRFQNIIVTRENGQTIVNTGETSANISFFNKLTGDVKSYEGTSASYNLTGDSIVICVKGHNKIPFIWDANDTLFLQNKTINGPMSFNAQTIKAGYNVTPEIENGNVIFNGGKVVLSGQSVELNRGTEIKLGTDFEIIPRKSH